MVYGVILLLTFLFLDIPMVYMRALILLIGIGMFHCSMAAESRAASV